MVDLVRVPPTFQRVSLPQMGGIEGGGSGGGGDGGGEGGGGEGGGDGGAGAAPCPCTGGPVTACRRRPTSRLARHSGDSDLVTRTSTVCFCIRGGASPPLGSVPSSACAAKPSSRVDSVPPSTLTSHGAQPSAPCARIVAQLMKRSVVPCRRTPS